MKPKIKSNTTLVVLLFAFLPGLLHAGSWPLADTLILDGEIVYIEPRDVMVNMDSLNKAMADDFRDLPRTHYFTFAAWGGPLFGFSSGSGQRGDQVALDQFIGQDSRWSITPAFGIEGAWQWTPRISICAGIGLEQWSYQWQQLDERTLAPDEQRFRFENREEQLWQYFTFEVGPGFEVDTTLVGTQLQTRTRTQLTMPVSVRYMPIPFSPKTNWFPFVDVGFQITSPLRSSDSFAGKGYFVSENGSFSAFSMSEAERQLPSARLLFQAGVWWAFSPQWMAQARISGGVIPVIQSQESGWELSTQGVVFGLGIGRRISTGRATSRPR